MESVSDCENFEGMEDFDDDEEWEKHPILTNNDLFDLITNQL